ncbi:MAG: LysM peptidoglycan-binding domain-containing protein [Opitutales bacterium]
MRLVILLLLSHLPLLAQNTAQLAGLQQDLVELRAEVEKLRLDNADLRAEVSRLRAAPAPAAKGVDAEALARLRAEMLAEVDRRLKEQTAAVNAALAELTKQVNAALGRPGAAVPAPGAGTPVSPNPAAPVGGFPNDMPQTGIKYTVKSGDSASRIARSNKSKVEWITKANSLSNPDDLKAGSVIFVPQLEETAR